MPKFTERKFSQDRALTATPAGNVELTGLDPNAADPKDRNVRVPVSLLPTGGGGEANTQTNEGGGAGLALTKVGINLPLRTFVSGDGSITFGVNADTLDLRAAAAGAALGDVTRFSGNGTVTAYNAAADTDIERGNAFHQAVSDMLTDDCLLLSAGVFELSYTAEIPPGSVIGRGQSTTLKGRFSNPAGTAFPIIVNKGADVATGYDAVDGWFIADLAVDSLTSGIGVAHARNVVFRNVIGRNASGGDKVGHFIDACGVEHFGLDGCSFRGSCTGAGIVQLDNCSTGALVWVREGGGTASVNPDGTPTRVVTIDSLSSEFTNSDGGANRVHIELHREGITDVVINNCTCKEGRALVKLVQESSDGGAFQRVAVTGCTFQSSDPQHDTDCIEITGGSTKRSNDIVVANNVVDTTGSRGIWVLDSDRVVVANNVVRIRHTTAASVLGAIIQGSANVSFRGNNLNYENPGAGSTGAVVSNGSTWVDISGNNLSKFDDGVNVGATAGTPVFVSLNTFEGASNRYVGPGEKRLPDGELSKLPENATPGTSVMLLSENDATGRMERVPVGSLPNGGGGEANTQSNQGGGVEIGLTKSGIDLPLRTLVSGDSSVGISQESNTIDLTAIPEPPNDSNPKLRQNDGTPSWIASGNAALRNVGTLATDVAQGDAPGIVNARIGNGADGNLVRFDDSNNHVESGTPLSDVTANTAHRGITSGNPHNVTAAEAGADPAGSAAAVNARVGNGSDGNLVRFDDSNNHVESGVALSDLARLSQPNVFLAALQVIQNAAAAGVDVFQTGQLGQSGRFRRTSDGGFEILTARNDAGAQAGDPLFTFAHRNNVAAQGVIVGSTPFRGADTLNAAGGLWSANKRVATGPSVHANGTLAAWNGTNTDDLNDSGTPVDEISTSVFTHTAQTAGTITIDRSNGKKQKVTLTGAATLATVTNTTEGQSGRIEVILSGNTLAFAGGWDIGGPDNPVPKTNGATVLLHWEHGAGGRLYLVGISDETAT